MGFLTNFFASGMMLAGLAAVAIPIIIHLLNRRRYDVVDWGAMQFLQISETTRRRLLIEEVILMILRMGLIAIMVMALALPFAPGSVLAKLGGQNNRDVVIIFDGSHSMGFTGKDKTPHDAAKEWALAFVDQLNAQDSVAVLQAKKQVIPVVGEPSVDLKKVREAIEKMPAPRGGSDLPQALQAAHEILARGKQAQRDIIVLTDGQRYGWADDNSMLHWEMLGEQLKGQQSTRPNIRVVNMDPDRDANPPNWSLAPVRVSRAVASAGQEIEFRTAFQLHGQESYQPPHRIRLDIDGRQQKDLEFPVLAKAEKGQVPFSFRQRFTTPGLHLVSVSLEVDDPANSPQLRNQLKDQLPGDNRQDFAVEVLEALPVLLVDGDTRPEPKTRGTDFLRDALAPSGDKTPVVTTKVVPIQDFDPDLLTRDLKDPGSKPRVLVLSNVVRLTTEQQDGVSRFLAAGGGVLVAVGHRADLKHYNEKLHNAGQGWLPARLVEALGDENDLDHAVNPLPASFYHPALELFRKMPTGGLVNARFPRWWKLAAGGKDSTAMPVALLTNQDPFLVERSYHGGRVLLAAVPFDNSWRTNLTAIPEFVPLAHEIIYYLAGARSAEHNLLPGQPLLYRPERDDPPTQLTLQPPEGEAKVLPVASWPFAYETTREPGVYRLSRPDGRALYYVVQSDPRESELKPGDEENRARVAKYLPAMAYENATDTKAVTVATERQKQDLWWLFMFGVIALLCSEVWMTRRIVKGR